jgi:hypothetical protein
MRLFHLRLLIGLLAFGCGGCFFVQKDERSITGPPTDSPVKAAQWWDDFATKGENLDFLALVLKVSETHRRKGTSASYEHMDMCRSMVKFYYFQYFLPLPMPDHAAALLRDRLQGYTPDCNCANYRSGRIAWWVTNTKGCTREEAMAIWDNAEKELGYKDEAVSGP